MLKDNLRALRESYRISQKTIANELGFSTQRYNNYETGKREPDEETLNRIALYYHIPVSQLFVEQSADYYPWWHRTVDRLEYLIAQKKLTVEEISTQTGISSERIQMHLSDVYTLSLREMKIISEWIESKFPVSHDEDYTPLSHRGNEELASAVSALWEKKKAHDTQYGAAQRAREEIKTKLDEINPEGIELISKFVSWVFSSPEFIRNPEEETFPSTPKED